MSKKIIKEYVGKMANMPDYQSSWWFSDEDSMPSDIKHIINRIEERQNNNRLMNLKYARLYSNLELLSLISGATISSNPTNFLNNTVTYNVVKSAIDTATSKITKNKPRIQFLTQDGDYELRTRAEKLSDYVEGVFYQNDVYELAKTMFIHAGVFGTGCIKVVNTGDSIELENVFIEEIKVDEIEGAYKKPRQLHQVKHMSRDLLLSMYPEHQDAILEASNTKISSSYDSVADMVVVTESWHLQSGKEAGDGLHTVSIENKILFKEEYKKDYFPFVFFRWNDRLSGFFGQGIAEELIGIQIEINKLLKNIQKAIHLVAVPRIAVEASTKLSSSTITNDIGSIFKYVGNQPNWFTPQAMTPEVYNHLKWLIQSAFEVTGISQLSATSKKPAGLDAAVALREFQDIETERFMNTAQRYENCFLDLAEIIIDISRDLYNDNPDLSIKTRTGNFIKSIKWSEVNLDDSSYQMKMFPVSLLPTTPSGRLQKIQELINTGLIPKEQALKLLDFPDLEAIEDLETASLKLTEKILFKIKDEGKYIPPEPQMQLDLAYKLTQQHYLKGKVEELPEEILELLLRFMDDIERLQGLEQPTGATPEQVQDVAAEALPTVNTAPLVTQ